MNEKEQKEVSSQTSYEGGSADTAGVKTTPEQSNEDLRKVVQMEVLDI